MDEITRYLGLREHFAQAGDRGLVEEVDAWLQRHGVTVATVAPITERAVPRRERAQRK